MGKIVKPYEIISQIGQGGMGVVYKARHLHLNKIVAIKQLWPQYSHDPVFIKYFLSGGKKLFEFDHKNIVKVFDILEEGGEYYIVMEFVEGRTLSEIIQKQVGPIYQERAINLFKQVLEGLAYIHNKPNPIIHRDIKPLNILVTGDDTVKITDFDISKVLEVSDVAKSTTVKGTPTYMSPEQIMDPSSVDIRTDIYSLGMTFYEMLCAKTPFEGLSSTTPTAVYSAIMNGIVKPPTHFYHGITESLSAFVMKAIDKDRDNRFANANEMLRELERLESSGQTTVQDTGKYIPHHRSEISETPTVVDTLPYSSPFEDRIGREAKPKVMKSLPTK
jgi:serine/threonine-protein kinase